MKWPFYGHGFIIYISNDGLKNKLENISKTQQTNPKFQNIIINKKVPFSWKLATISDLQE